MGWRKRTSWTGLVLVIAAAIVFVAGTERWSRQSDRMIALLGDATTLSPDPFTYDQLADLPAPVAQYFRTVLSDGQPMITLTKTAQEGTFQSAPGKSPLPFTASQSYSADPPGYVWDARIRMARFVNVTVRDAYVEREGRMQARLFAMLPIMNEGGAPELDAGALQRYLAEAVWYPTALLPCSGVRWTPIDERSALATVADGDTEVSLVFRFNEAGEVDEVFTPERYREVDGDFVPTPWRGRFHRYEKRQGVRIPIEGEVAWLLDEGEFTYWRGRITSIAYDFRSGTQARNDSR